MHLIAERDSGGLDPASEDCLGRTRSAVLNVLVAVGLTIAVSGGLLRGHQPETPWRAAHSVHQTLTVAWVILGAASYFASIPLAAEHSGRSRPAASAVPPSSFDPGGHRGADHPLGLVEGWIVDPRLPALIPFWVMPLTLGALAFRVPASWRGWAQTVVNNESARRMSGLEIAILWVYAGMIAIWPVRLLVLAIILKRQEFLDSGSPRYDRPDAPLVSAILPAKDEESNIHGCLTSVCRQTYPNLEVLVVDDRSTDQTNAIAQEFANRDSRIQVLKIDHLPGGWTGKTHAIQVATETAKGEWLWFLDADTLHSPESLSIMMEFARSNRASLVSLLPELRCETFWERVFQPLAGITLMQSSRSNRSTTCDLRWHSRMVNISLLSDPPMTRQAVTPSCADRFVEDIALAGRVKALGLPIRVALIRRIVSCRMYSSLEQLVRGWSRIYYNALDRSPMRLLAKLLDPLIFCQSGHVALVVSLVMLLLSRETAFACWLGGLSIMHHIWMYALFRRIHAASVPGCTALWYPLGNLLVDAALHPCHHDVRDWSRELERNGIPIRGGRHGNKSRLHRTMMIRHAQH